MTEFQVKGATFGMTNLVFKVWAKDPAMNLKYPGVVVQQDMSRDLDPNFYQQHGF